MGNTVGTVGKYDLQPILLYGGKPKQNICQQNLIRNQVCFQALYGTPMLEWWPRHEDDILVTHLYRLIDERYGSDLIHPPSSTAMSHRLHIQYNLI